LKHDKSKSIDFLPLQTPLGQKLLQDHGIDPADAETFLLLKNETPYLRSDAAMEIARNLGWWRWLRVFRILPRPWRDYLYGIIARNRYRWFGRRDTCFVPTAEERQRFPDGEGT
jgi:predicted DCC family thiol-disulfide oxidoreductase YuxK